MKVIYIALFLVIPAWGISQNDTVKRSADTLTGWQMDSLQLNAIQKLRSLYNCISIMTNPDYHQELRDEAARRAKKTFYGPDCSIDGKVATAYIDSCSNFTKGVRYRVDNIVLKGDMKKISGVLDDENYQGMLIYTLALGSDSPIAKKAYITFSRKTPGDPTAKAVWSVFICDIR